MGKAKSKGGKKAPTSAPVTENAAATGTGGISFGVIAAAIALVAVAISVMPMVIKEGSVEVPKKVTKGMSMAAIRQRAKTTPCKNKHSDSQCDNFASAGSCEEAPGWMAVFCAASCDTCELLDPNVRCDPVRIGYDPSDVWQQGSVDELFTDLAERWPQYNVTYLSRPPEGPWVAKFHNFLSEEEIDALIDQTDGNLRRSTDQGGFDDEGVQEQVLSKGRTSMNAWCMGACESHPLIAGVSHRISEVTRIPEDNFESFQILRYEHGQEYVRHHDSSESDNKLLSGPRILTFYLYLSDVEAGGGTQFTDLKPPLTNLPEKGSAILWPSVLNEDPTKLEKRTHHAALPVEKGIKFGANHWIHLRNYKVPNLHGCTGSFTEE